MHFELSIFSYVSSFCFKLSHFLNLSSCLHKVVYVSVGSQLFYRLCKLFRLLINVVSHMEGLASAPNGTLANRICSSFPCRVRETGKRPCLPLLFRFVGMLSWYLPSLGSQTFLIFTLCPTEGVGGMAQCTCIRLCLQLEDEVWHWRQTPFLLSL